MFFIRILTVGTQSELRSCVKVEMAVLRCPSLTVLMVSVDVKQLLKMKKLCQLCAGCFINSEGQSHKTVSTDHNF